MRYYFGGSEIKAWRDLLTGQHVPAMALSYVGLKRRLKKKFDGWNIKDNYPAGTQIFLDSGAYTLNKEDSEYTKEQATELLEEFVEFALANIDSVSLVSEFDANIFGYEAIKDFRNNIYDDFPPEKFMPIWHAEYGVEELGHLCSMYDRVGVTQFEMHDTSLIPTFNSMINRYGVKLHGVAITGRDKMKQIAWDSVSSISWLSPLMFGDTIVWTGKELKRYPKAYKGQARKKHRSIFITNGFDHNKIENDDSQELLKLSIWSWQKFVSSLDSRPVTMMYPEQNEQNGNISTLSVDTHVGEMRNEKLLPTPIERRETQPLPIAGFIKKAENPEDENSPEVSYLYKRSESMRICNTCFLREKCPMFKTNANCAYNFPLEIKTTEQLRALRDSIIEMQTHRVFFMQMAEDLEGGYADPNLSSEIDRLSRLIKSKEDGEKDIFTVTQTATLSSGQPGFLSQILGDKAVNKLRELDSPVDADKLIAEQILDGEVVE